MYINDWSVSPRTNFCGISDIKKIKVKEKQTKNKALTDWGLAAR